ncbi:MAG: carbohydrate kinase family protein [Candidatus Helarchaeota archaeon]
MLDCTIFGHFCLDYFKGRERFPDYIRLGGTTVYASKTAQRLNKKVAIVSSIGPDFKHELIEPLKKDGIKIHLIKSKLNSTAFVHQYIKKQRILTLKSRCKMIEDSDIPNEYLNSKLFLIGAVANEVDTSVLTKISQLNVPIGLDLHGFLRNFDENGKMRLNEWFEADDYLQHVTFLKGTDKEAKVLTGLKNLQEIARVISNMGPKIVVITRGRKGSFVYSNNISLQIPTIAKNIIDETGAGDTYFTAFIFDYLQNEDLYHAALFGASAASFVMEKQGPFGFASQEEIENRIREFINK